jgi:Ca2+/Na+ antiporter
MENITSYNISEIVALLTSVLIGSGAYIAFVRAKREKPVNLPFIISTVAINIFLTNVASEVLKIAEWGAYRSLVLPVVAYCGQYLLEWFDKRRDNIFDSASKKAGFDLTQEKKEKKEENENEGNSD